MDDLSKLVTKEGTKRSPLCAYSFLLFIQLPSRWGQHTFGVLNDETPLLGEESPASSK